VREDLREEVLRAVRTGLAERTGRGVLDDLAVGHEHNPLGGAVAKPISWVTTSIVMPSLAGVVNTPRTSAHHVRRHKQTAATPVEPYG
jgi:hypothetical protein